MPELLLSSLPGKDLSLNTKSKPLDTSVETLESPANANKFTNMLSSVVSQLNPDKAELDEGMQRKELLSSLEKLSEELSQFDLDIAELSELTSFLNGNDLTTQGLGEGQLGVSLPDFFKQLQTKINDLSNAINEQEGLPADQLSGLDFALSQLSQIINVVSYKDEAQKQGVTPTLLGFSFNSGNGRSDGSNWQKYDPQQMSQNGLISADNVSDTGLMPEQLVPKTDRSFQLQMEQLVVEKTFDETDKTNVFVDTDLEVKDRAVNNFSDLQLKSAGEGLKQYSTTLSTPVTAQNWSDELSQKVVWFSGRNISAAEMHLNPAELGPIDVKINVQNDVASITFNVSNSSVKDLLESSVVRLREMMEANGINVGEVSIDSNARGNSGQQGSGDDRPEFAGSGRDMSELDEDVVEQTMTLKETNLVDYFA
tara:strand:+ start:2309 stop:3583 length:1275 start_codon:yes stop_codon:yes gene_type:complete